jgi:hypothetical protein
VLPWLTRSWQQIISFFTMTYESEPQVQMQAIHKQVDGWFEAFLGSPQYQRIPEAERDRAHPIVRILPSTVFAILAPRRRNGVRVC